MKLFLQKKKQNFRALGVRPQTPKHPPPLRIPGYAPGGNYAILSPKSSEDQKKRSSSQFGTIFARTLRDLFVLTNPFSSDHPALKSRWGHAYTSSTKRLQAANSIKDLYLC